MTLADVKLMLARRTAPHPNTPSHPEGHCRNCGAKLEEHQLKYGTCLGQDDHSEDE